MRAAARHVRLENASVSKRCSKRNGPMPDWPNEKWHKIKGSSRWCPFHFSLHSAAYAVNLIFDHHQSIAKFSLNHGEMLQQWLLALKALLAGAGALVRQKCKHKVEQLDRLARLLHSVVVHVCRRCTKDQSVKCIRVWLWRNGPLAASAMISNDRPTNLNGINGGKNWNKKCYWRRTPKRTHRERLRGAWFRRNTPNWLKISDRAFYCVFALRSFAQSRWLCPNFQMKSNIQRTHKEDEQMPCTGRVSNRTTSSAQGVGAHHKLQAHKMSTQETFDINRSEDEQWTRRHRRAFHGTGQKSFILDNYEAVEVYMCVCVWCWWCKWCAVTCIVGEKGSFSAGLLFR